VIGKNGKVQKKFQKYHGREDIIRKIIGMKISSKKSLAAN